MPTDSTSTILAHVINQVAGELSTHLHSPLLDRSDQTRVAECVSSGYVSSISDHVQEFESHICRITGSRNAVAVINGTAGLCISLIALGLKRGHEVFVPSLSFVATASAVVQAGGIPHFLDVDLKTAMGVNPVAFQQYLEDNFDFVDGTLINTRTGNHVFGLIPVHILGFPCWITELADICANYGLIVVEDAAEALGSKLHGTHVGTCGSAGIFSFNGNKIITTGGGGVIVTDNDHVAAKIRHLSTTAKVLSKVEFDHDAIGYNLRLPGLNAALGCSQAEKFPQILSMKRDIYQRYEELLSNEPNIKLLAPASFIETNYWLISVLLIGNEVEDSFEIAGQLIDLGIGVRPLWNLLPELAPYKRFPSQTLAEVKQFHRKILCLPSSPAICAKV